jgi:phosphopantothenoylcysteine decarboxylase/phosphopantothenate--cysteine ligase
MKILLNVCGSISAYKALDISRGLIKAGHQVRVVLSKGALQFVVPQVFKYLGAEEVYLPEDDFKYPKNPSDGNVLHIELSKWCEKFVIAPLSANTLSKMAYGEASDLMLSTFLALPNNVPILIFPAMNERMLTNPLVKENFSKLERLFPNLLTCPTEYGELACGDVGKGKLLDVSKIIEIIPNITPIKAQDTKHLLITTGATLAPLDPVRYLTNSSSGITGYYLALTALSLGHTVTVIAGKNSTKKLNYLDGLPGYKLIQAITTKDFQRAALENLETADCYISSAALGDIEFDICEDKLKKKHLGDTLKINRSPDVLKEVLAKRKSHQKVVGFAAEVDLSFEMLRMKWEDKPVDLLIGTRVHNGLTQNGKVQGFETENADYKFLHKGEIVFEGPLSKKELASKILERVLN